MNIDINQAHPYEDIINLPRHKSKIRPPMSRINRAAQFSPFAALTGYDDAVKETARLTMERVILDENEKSKLDEKLRIIKEEMSSEPELTITYFQEDEKKSGGSYISVCKKVKKINYYEEAIIMGDGTKIRIKDIYNIKGDILKSHDNAIL